MAAYRIYESGGDTEMGDLLLACARARGMIPRVPGLMGSEASLVRAAGGRVPSRILCVLLSLTNRGNPSGRVLWHTARQVFWDLRLPNRLHEGRRAR
jgi:hypothetical protein